MLLMRQNMADMFRDFYNQMAEHSMIGFYNLGKPSLLLRDPELVRIVLSKNFQNFANNSFELDKQLDPLLCVGSFFANGDWWKASRQQLGPAFTPKKLRYMYHSVTDACSKLEEYLDKRVSSSEGEVELNLKDLFSRYTAEVLAGVAFGVHGGSFDSDDGGPFREVGRMMYEPSFSKGLGQILIMFVPILSKILKVRFLPVKGDLFLRKVVDDVLKRREEEGFHPPDFLQLMNEYKKTDRFEKAFERKFDNGIITSHAASLFDDGFETSSITLSFLTYLLAVNPVIQDRLREEVTKVFAKHGSLTADALQEMTYMDRAMSETMRLYPAFGAFEKVCTEGMELTGSDGITHQVPTGTNVVIPVYALHMDPKYWSNPEKFYPDRFSEENKNSRPRFVYLPFGEGPRGCPGVKLAMLQMKAVIATIIKKYIWDVSPRTREL